MKKATGEKQLTAINGFLAATLSSVVALFIITDISRSHLAIVTALVYALIAAIMIANWRFSSAIRNGVLVCMLILVVVPVMGLYNQTYLTGVLTRSIFLLLSIVTLANVKITARMTNIISIIMLILLAIFTVRSFGYYGAFFQTNPLSTGYNINNPNSMGLVVLFAYMLVDRGITAKNNVSRILVTILAFVAMYNYAARAAALCLIVYLLLAHYYKRHSRPSRKTLYKILVICALIFPAIYVHTYNKSSSKAQEAVILGKNIYSGRQDIWSTVLTGQDSSKLMIGSTDTKSLKSFPSGSIHNMYIDIIFRLGLFYLLIFLATIYYFVIKNSALSNKMFSSIIALLIYGIFESAFTGGTYNGMLMLLAFMNMDVNYQILAPKGENDV